jgi:hypothetical protein
VLRDIWRQLDADPAPPDHKDALQAFLLAITEDKTTGRVGERSVVDLCKLAERYYFRPQTKGSCSVKKVLPAVLSSSPFLRERYSRTVYGAAGGIPGHNFKDWIWWQGDGETVREPDGLLPPVFADLDDYTLAALCLDEDDSLAQGGAALTAYQRLQFEDIDDQERARLQAAGELDTLAMVMIWQTWTHS